jgi:general secretion pathway protein D
MRIFLLLLSFAFFTPGQAFCSGLTFRLDQVPATQLLSATYKNILGLSYAVDPDLILAPPLVTLDIRDWPVNTLGAAVDGVLKRAGVEKTLTPEGLVYFSLAHSPAPSGAAYGPATQGLSFDNSMPSIRPPASSEPFNMAPPAGAPSPSDFSVYLPRNRTVTSMQSIANQLLGTNFQPGEAVVLSGDPERVEKARFVLESLDVRAGEVSAKALVVEFNTNEVRGNTFEFALKALSGKLNISIASLLSPGENVIKFASSDFSAILSAVAGDSRFNVVSSPVLRVRDGKKGVVEVGEEVPTLSTTSFDNQGNAQQSIKYRSAGVIFELKPSIMKDRIELELKQQISDFKPNNLSGIDSPTLSKRELSTVVQAQDGEMIVLGGLEQNKETTATRGFSFLPEFLRSNSSDKTKTQILIFLTVARI